MKDSYYSYLTLWIYNKIFQKLTGRRIKSNFHYESSPLDTQETNDKIAELILSGSPFMAARFGRTELQTMTAYQKECHNPLSKAKYSRRIVNLSGFFEKDSNDIQKFVTLMEDSCKYVDLMGIWYIEMEDYFINKCCSRDITLGRLQGLEPWHASANPWSSHLLGKKVVFVHPFKNTIEHQLQYGDKLFENKNMFPECDIRVVQAVQTIAGNHDERFISWFDALEYMYNEVMKEDFDIAIIGCGAYGFPLAAMIKKAGKSAIHLGGATQLFFGIKGSRWDNHPTISKLYNDYWTYPLDEDRPPNLKSVEKGCYW